MQLLKSYALFLRPNMTVHTSTFQLKYKIYSLVMLLALAWLTISLPFVYADQQAQKESIQKTFDSQPDEDDSNSLTNNTTEEKTSNTTSLSEYLHDFHTTEHPSSLVIKTYKCHVSDLYLAFHPELICPPPDAFAS